MNIQHQMCGQFKWQLQRLKKILAYLHILDGLHNNALFGTVWSQTVESLLQDKTLPIYDGVTYCATPKKTCV